MQKKSVKKNRRRVNQTRRRKSIMRGGGGFSNCNRLKNAIQNVVKKGFRMENGLSKDVERMAEDATTIFYKGSTDINIMTRDSMKRDLIKLMEEYADVI